MDTQKERKNLVRLDRHRKLSNQSLSIGRLNILGFYSMNTNYEFTDDLSQLRYLKLPSGQHVKFDLKVNSQKTIRRKLHTNEVKIDSLLKWIIAHWKECVETPSPRRIREIVSYRGLLTKVMVSPYERHDGWIICASKFQGKIYLCKYETPEQVKAEENRTERERDMCDWGYVFEQYMVSDHPKQPPNLSLPTDQNEEFSCVFRTRLGHHDIMFGAEMDGLKIDDKLGNIEEPVCSSAKLKELLEKKVVKFVELKTSADASSNHFEWKKICRFKSLRWWTQCYMAGIQEVVCGYRDNDGVVRKLQTFNVGSLPQLGQGNWNPDVCLDYCIRFLDVVTNHVSNGPDELMWSFTWKPQNPDYLEIEHCNDSQYLFLHGWFTNEFKKNTKRKCDSSPSSLRETDVGLKAKIKN